MSRAPDDATFIASLRREVVAFGEFIEVLSAEQEHLTHAEIDPLADICQRKTEKAEELSALARLRRAFLEAHGLPANADGLRRWIESQGDAEAKELFALWSQLSERANNAQRMNRTNGSLINSRLAFNRQALNALSGLTRPMGVYGPDGSTSVRVAHRDFGAA